MKAAKVNKAEYVYPEYLMLCKLVQRVVGAKGADENREAKTNGNHNKP